MNTLRAYLEIFKSKGLQFSVQDMSRFYFTLLCLINDSVHYYELPRSSNYWLITF